VARNSKKRKREQALAATGTPSRGGCTVCGDPFHVAAECFKPGGGLAHYDAKQRGEHIEKKRQERAARKWQQQQQQQQQQQYPPQYPPQYPTQYRAPYPNMTWQAQMPPPPPQQQQPQQQQQQKGPGAAMSAIGESQKRVIAALEEKLRLQQNQMTEAKRRVQEMLPAYDIGY